MKEPIFVLGNRRSGTTMLRLMLTCHPHIAIPPEGGFILRLQGRYGSTGLPTPAAVERFLDDLFRIDNTRDWRLDRELLRDRLCDALPLSFPDAVAGVFEAWVDLHSAGASRWGDKTTWYHIHLEHIDALFPDARYVHIIRDGRDVAASFKKVDHLTDSVESIACEWRWAIGAIRTFGGRLGEARYHEVRYEELVESPEAVLRVTSDFLGEPYSPSMLEFGAMNRERELEPRRHLGWKEKTLGVVTSSSVGRWQEVLTREERDRFTGIARDPLRRLGYSNRRPDLSPLQSLGLRVSWWRYATRRAFQRRLHDLRVNLGRARG